MIVVLYIMFWRIQGGRYWIKNFRNHMDIKDNVTLGGLIRRFQRKHPKITNFVRKGFLTSSLFCIIMIMIPGCGLPLQTQIKISMLNVYSSCNKDLVSCLQSGTTIPFLLLQETISSSSIKSY